MLVIAHLSDIHIGGSAQAVARAGAVMRYLDALPADLDMVLVTGDIADHGLAGEYEQARKLLTSRHPVLVCPGNHDVREEFRRVLLGEPPSAGPINQVHRTAKAVYALCDSSIPGEDSGHLEEQTLTWLEGVLENVGQGVKEGVGQGVKEGVKEGVGESVLEGGGLPVFVAFHHPPALLFCACDRIRLHRHERLAELVAGHANVAALLVGHAHTGAATTFAGRPLLVAPGVLSTLKLPWEGGTTLDNCADYELPPAIAFHVLDDEGRMTTHYRVVQV
jgi:Icc protein